MAKVWGLLAMLLLVGALEGCATIRGWENVDK